MRKRLFDITWKYKNNFKVINYYLSDTDNNFLNISITAEIFDFCKSARTYLSSINLSKNNIYYFIDGIMVSKNKYKKYKMEEVLK